MFSKKRLQKSNKVDPKRNKNPLELLEPFQEVIDEALDVDWGELESKNLACCFTAFIEAIKKWHLCLIFVLL